MQWRVSAHWLVKTLRFALLIEKTILVTLCNKEIKLEVSAREVLAACNGCPFAESNGFALSSAIGQCVAADDILLQYVSEAFVILVKKR